MQDAFFETRRYGYVSDLMVIPELRRRGIGRLLWDRVALWCRSVGLAVVRLHVATRSPEARAFWQRVGAADFLAEAWIDLPSTEQLAAARSAEAAAESARAMQAGGNRELLRGERLTGDAEVL